METIKAFFNDYGYSFLMMVVIGSVIALITEITVKKAFEWLEAKIGDKLPKALPILRISAIQFATWLQVLVFTKMLVDNMPFPAGKVFYPIWIFCVYVIQFIVSCWGLKGLMEWAKRKADQPPRQKPVKKDPLEGLTPVPGTRGLWTDGNNNYYNRKGVRQ